MLNINIADEIYVIVSPVIIEKSYHYVAATVYLT